VPFKILILNLIVLFSTYNYAQDAWGTEVNLSVNEKSLRYVLCEIRSQADLNLIYDANLVSSKLLTYNIKSNAEDVISEVLSKNGFLYRKFNLNTAVIYKNKDTPKKNKAVVSKTNIDEVIAPSQKKILKPVLLTKNELVYPQEAIRDRLEGEVFTRILVTSKGLVSEVILEKSSGYKVLDTATINYVSKLNFLPAEHNGKYMSIWTTMLVKFNFE